jgi:hypothetical protein
MSRQSYKTLWRRHTYIFLTRIYVLRDFDIDGLENESGD